MEREILIGGDKLKEEDDLEEALNEIIGQEEIITGDLITNEMIKNEMLFDINKADIVVNEIRDVNIFTGGETHFQNLLQKYICMRKLGPKSRWLRFKSSLARKKKKAVKRFFHKNKTKRRISKSTKRPPKTEQKSSQRRKSRRCNRESSELPSIVEGCHSAKNTKAVRRRKHKQTNVKTAEADNSGCPNQDVTVKSDEMLYCDGCCRSWSGDCPEHGPLLIIDDFSFPNDSDDKCRAEKTSPPQVSVSNSVAESGVWVREAIPARTRFGPFEGKVVSPEVRTAYSWLVWKDGKPDHCLDATEPSLSNWMRYVNCARHSGQQNMHAFQFQGKIYYRTIRAVEPGEELLVWFDEEYGRQLGVDCSKNNFKEMCPECPYPCASPMYLLQHKDHSHKDLRTTQDVSGKEAVNSESKQERRQYNRSAKAAVSYNEAPNRDKVTISRTNVKVEDVPPTTNPKTGEMCYACPVCNKHILRKSHLKRHLLIHSDVKPYTCEFCNREFARKDNFDSHVKLRHSDRMSPTTTERKSSSAAKGKKVVNHTRPGVATRGLLNKRPKSNVVQKPFVCNHCDKRFTRKEEVQAHLSVHVREKPFSCNQCQKRFIHRSGLVTHQRTHNSEIKLLANKSIVDRKGKEKINLGTMCRVCGLQCRSLEHLTSHEHTHEERFSTCFVCNKKFSHVNHLKRHLLIHAGYRPHGCPYCDQKFSRTEHLKRHIRTHTRQGAYECGKCKKRFAKKIVFERHVRLHNEDAPCLQDQRLYVNFNFQKQLESYMESDDDYDAGNSDGDDKCGNEDVGKVDCDVVKQEVEECDDDEEPLMNVFPEVILGSGS